MFRAAPGNATQQMRPAAQETLASWMDNIAADDSDLSKAEKVVANKPASAVDACWKPDGTRVNEPAVVNGTGTCAELYSPHRLPDQMAGKPIGSTVIKCELKPIVAGDYGSPNANQLARLNAIFPGGVCDYTKPGVGEQEFDDTWRSYGPERSDRKRRSLSLQAKRAGGSKQSGKRKGGKVRSKLVAKARPCPQAKQQKVVFERRAGGKWRRIGSAYTSGGGCKATLETRLPRRTKVRATAPGGDGYAGATDTARTR
jgi:hypothetical protein